MGLTRNRDRRRRAWVNGGSCVARLVAPRARVPNTQTLGAHTPLKPNPPTFTRPQCYKRLHHTSNPPSRVPSPRPLCAPLRCRVRMQNVRMSCMWCGVLCPVAAAVVVCARMRVRVCACVRTHVRTRPCVCALARADDSPCEGGMWRPAASAMFCALASAPARRHGVLAE